MVRLICGVLSVCCALMALPGCRGLENPWRQLPPPTVPLTDADPVWQRLAERRRAFGDLKGLAQVRVRTTLHSASLDETVVVLRHFDALRLEGIGPVGQPVFLLVADQAQLSLYMPQDGRLLVGAASAENFRRLFGLALPPNALHYLLLGDIPTETLPAAGKFAYVARDNLYIWEGLMPHQTQYYRVWFEPYDLQPVRLEIEDPPGAVVLQVQYNELQRFDGLTLPARITIVQPTTNHQVVWRYSDVQLNTGVAPALFQLRLPRGTERIALEDIAETEALLLPRVR